MQEKREGAAVHFSTLFEQIDTNSDGMIDREEAKTQLEAAHEGDMLTVLFKTFDANEDGKISKEELLAHIEATFVKMLTIIDEAAAQ
mmetsp:Transcript_14918/g.18757  ORF Transcript_14918/g.18757 Transcript_14918/m.18757 type:complete len:87 (+) Transcript_14918:159-419(+)